MCTLETTPPLKILGIAGININWRESKTQRSLNLGSQVNANLLATSNQDDNNKNNKQGSKIPGNKCIYQTNRCSRQVRVHAKTNKAVNFNDKSKKLITRHEVTNSLKQTLWNWIATTLPTKNYQNHYNLQTM